MRNTNIARVGMAENNVPLIIILCSIILKCSSCFVILSPLEHLQSVITFSNFNLVKEKHTASKDKKWFLNSIQNMRECMMILKKVFG